MKSEDKKQYELENFNGLYPLIGEMLKQVKPTDKTAEYVVNGASFQIRQNGDVVEMGLSVESSIFPTLTFKKLPNEQVELLYYRIGKEFKDAIFQATGMFVAGKPKVSLIFKKTLGIGVGGEISFESTLPNMFSKSEYSTVTLEIDKLRNHKLSDYWDKQQPNTNALFANKNASLVIYYGDVEAFGKGQKQAIQVTDDSVFIMWRVESVEYLNGIANNLRYKSEASLKIDLDEDDYFFSDKKSMYKTSINKISITFN